MELVDRQRLARYQELKRRRTTELTRAEIAERQELRLWVASKHTIPTIEQGDPESPTLAPTYVEGEYAGALVLDAGYYKIRPNRSGAATWHVNSVKTPAPSRMRGVRPTRSRPSRARAKALTRCSSRSGDSGSDEPEPDPPRVRRGLFARPARMPTGRRRGR